MGRGINSDTRLRVRALSGAQVRIRVPQGRCMAHAFRWKEKEKNCISYGDNFIGFWVLKGPEAVDEDHLPNVCPA